MFASKLLIKRGGNREGSSKHMSFQTCPSKHDRYVIDRREHDFLAFSRQTSCYFWSRSSKLFQKQL